MTSDLLPQSTTESREKEAYARAIQLLARREHTQQELLLKLGKAGFDNASIDLVLQRLAEKGFQSDQRFAELFVEQRFNKGYGERDIQAKLVQRGVSRQLAASALVDFVSSGNIDWYAHAAAVLSARFDLSAQASPVLAEPDEDMTAGSRRENAARLTLERQRRRKQWGNFLLRRGFSNDQVITAIDDHASASE